MSRSAVSRSTVRAPAMASTESGSTAAAPNAQRPVQVGPGDPPRGADGAHHVAADDEGAGFHVDAGEMGQHREHAQAVIEDDR